MKVRLRGLLVPVFAACVAVGCSDDDGPTNPIEGPPDLTGDYVLVTITQGGITLGPPAASGTFTIDETASSDTEASGTVDLDLTLPDGMGGQNNIVDSGTYTIRSDGTWEQSFPAQQAIGTYAVVGSTLTVTVTDPPVSASVSVWQRQ